MKYISLLRGINVSGQKKILMNDLKTLYEGLGFEDVSTYIQSGNVIFNTTIRNRSALTNRIENAIEKKYQFHVPSELRTNREFADIIHECPYGSKGMAQEGTKILVSFLSARPQKNKLDEIMTYAAADERLVLKDREIYLYCPNGYGRSKLSNAFLEKKLGVGATTRNWKSVIALYELSL